MLLPAKTFSGTSPLEKQNLQKISTVQNMSNQKFTVFAAHHVDYSFLFKVYPIFLHLHS